MHTKNKTKKSTSACIKSLVRSHYYETNVDESITQLTHEVLLSGSSALHKCVDIGGQDAIEAIELLASLSQA